MITKPPVLRPASPRYRGGPGPVSWLSLCLGFLLMVPRPAPAAEPPADHAARVVRGRELFSQHVRSILADRCVQCHGGEKTKGGLDLASSEGLLRGGIDGPAVVPFDAGSSRLLRLVRHTEEPHMPSKAPALDARSIEFLADWINHGAPYVGVLATNANARPVSGREWWAFQPLKDVQPPTVRDAGWIRTPVDQFILADLEKDQLRPAPPTDRRRWLRRVYFDLLGLPPTPAEVDAFEADTAPDAWQRWATRILERPEYGERWARHWLDVARFAESSGFEHDYDRPFAYHYRDFVIRALNDDMPYDQFVRWQLAGDEFEPDNPLALMATGFLGAGVFPTQITANEVERTRYDAMDDMLATTGTAMLGLTVGCARCHDHKYDPIGVQDYYRLLATFTTTVRSEIELDLDPVRTREERRKFEVAHEPRRATLRQYEDGELPERFSRWLASGPAVTNSAPWQVLAFTSMVSRAGAKFSRQADGSYLVSGANGDHDRYTLSAELPPGEIRSLRVEALADPSMTKGGPGRAPNGNIGLSRIRLLVSPVKGGPTNELKLTAPRATFEQNSGGLAVASALDNDPRSGWAVDPRFGTNHAAAFELATPLVTTNPIRLAVVLEFELNAKHNIGRPRVSLSAMARPGLTGQGMPAPLVAALARREELRRDGPGALTRLTPAEREVLLQWWRTTDAEWVRLHQVVAESEKQAPKPKLTKVLVCAEGFKPVRMHTQGADFFPDTYLLHRGSPDLKRGVVQPGFLPVLMPVGDRGDQWRWKAPTNAPFSGRRRSLALWMTDPSRGSGHLLARVMVNRLWQHHFGSGLVSTPNDFGAQGARPANPALLDWLATELIRHGWRLKPLHAMMVTSATYRQSAGGDPATRAADPDNRRWSRWTPRRLEAEALRDSILSVCGVLDPQRYGPGTLDDASRRRSIYFTVKRSRLVPWMQLFDAPEPLVSQGSRPVTTVAPQALLLLNNPAVRSWAGSMARRLGPVDAWNPAGSVEQAYRLAFGRRPAREEAADAVAFLEAQRTSHAAAGRADAGLLALTDFSQVVLGLNEFAYVE